MIDLFIITLILCVIWLLFYGIGLIWIKTENIPIEIHNKIGLWTRIPFIFICIIILPFIVGLTLGIHYLMLINWILLILGVFFIILGLFLLVRTKSKLNEIFGGENLTPKNLITDGIYGVVRNPMYAGFFFIGLGIAMIFPHWETFTLEILALIGLALYTLRFEEPLVNRLFGDNYRTYQQKTPAFLNHPLKIFLFLGWILLICGILLQSNYV